MAADSIAVQYGKRIHAVVSKTLRKILWRFVTGRTEYGASQPSSKTFSATKIYG